MSIAAFTSGQRRSAIVLLLVAVAVNGVLLLSRRSRIIDPAPLDAPRAAELVGGIDPNTADVASIAALPQMGQTRAEALVAYRERRLAADANVIVFKEPRDLLAVPGVGVTIMEHVRPYLVFP